MEHVNWWLIGLAFMLGLLLTFALMIRRVKREVPVSLSTAAAATGGPAGEVAESKTTTMDTAKTSTAERAATTETPTPGEAPTTKVETTGAGAAESKTEKSESELESDNNEDTRGE
jgi:uncharacterized membrane protein ArfC